MKAILFAILALSLSACSSSTDDTGGTTKKDAGADGAGDTGASTMDTGSSTDTGSGTETGGGDEACLMETGQDCITCCATNHMDGYKTYASTLVECTCKDTTCKTDCAATVCASTPKNPDATCNTCFKGMAAQMECGTALSAACGSGDCKAFYDCATACPM